LDDDALESLFRSFPVAAKDLQAVAIGLAGARAETDRARIRQAAARVWPGVPCHATNDLETALLAADDSPANTPRVLVLSGTGSCCLGRTPDGRTFKVGGWGHLLGDQGSGYDLGMRALRVVLRERDANGIWPELGRRLLRALQLSEPDDLIAWVQRAEKGDVAALAVEVFAAAAQGDRLARRLVAETAVELAEDALTCARRLTNRRPSPPRFILAGGLLLRQPGFRRAVVRRIRQSWPHAVFVPLSREGAWGAVRLALELGGGGRSGNQTARPSPRPVATSTLPEVDSAELRESPTEQRNPRSRRLDRLSIESAIDLMLREDARIPVALRAERAKIARIIRAVVRAFRRGGRLFYVGAGTSGRLGVLDASECPPTFLAPPDQVQGIIAGGQRALWQAAEGAEDDATAGGRAMEFRGVGPRDVIVGIAASGRTPFVWGALDEARRRGAFTALLCFNPRLRVPRSRRPRVILAPSVGPEVLTGSTRLKAGTATKLVLNMVSTLAMVRLGKVISNLMVDLNPSNAKLRDRAVRIVRELTGVEAAVARAALERAGWRVKAAIGALRR